MFTLVLCKAAVEDWWCKLEDGSDSGLIDSAELLNGGTQILKPDKDPEVLGCSSGDIKDMVWPAEVAG